jgi:hypothetical protein
MLQAKVTEARTAYPNLSDAQIEAVVKDYANSDEYYDKMNSLMSPGFRLATQGNRWANAVTGLEKRPDQQTLVDDLEQLVGQSFIGIPKSVQSGIMTQMRKKLGNAVVDSALSRVALKAAEVVSPVTLPFTPGNVALNIANGTALTEGISAVSNQPGLVNGGIAEFTPEQIEEVPELTQITPDDAATLPVPGVEPQDGHGLNVNGQIEQTAAAGGIGLGAFFALPAFRKAATQRMSQNAIKAIDQAGLDGGRSLVEQATRLDPMLSPVAGAVDSQAPIRRGANQFDLQPSVAQHVSKLDMIDAMDAHMSTAQPSNIVDSVSNVINHGTLQNHPDTVPVMTIRRAAEALTPPDRALLAKYGIAKQRQQDAAVRADTLTKTMRDTNLEYQAAAARGDVSSANRIMKKMQELQVKQQNLQADAPETRNIMESWTKPEVDEIIRVAEQNPNVMGVANMQRGSGHDMLNYQVKNGYITSNEATVQAMNRDFYFPMRERAYGRLSSQFDEAGVEKSGQQKLIDNTKRSALLFRDRVIRKGKTDTDFYSSDAVRNLDERAGGKVNLPKDPIVSLQEAWADTVKSVTANNARRTVVDTLRTFKGAEGTMFEQWEHNGRKSFSTDEYFNPETGIRAAVEGSNVPMTRIIRDGRFEFYKWSDDSMAHALEFAPLSTIPILNSTRKAWQSATTGVFAPWFAVKSAIWDVGVARATMRQGRSLGVIDTYARRVFNESKLVNNIMDRVPDPTAAISVMGAIPYALSMRAARAIGHKVADDLALNNGLFNMVAKVPGGRRFIEDIGTGMQKAFDRSVYNVYSRNLSSSMGLLQENTRILNDYNALGGRLHPLGEGVRNVWRGYKALVESVQGNTRVAFFYENYARLEAKHGGTVPKGELDKLVRETKALTGDMSKTSGSNGVQLASSTIPYLNPTLQGTRHMLGSALTGPMAKAINKVSGGKANLVEDRPTKFWTQFIGGTVLPAVGAYAVINQWPSAADYWYNKTPEWRQQTGIPIPTADVLGEYMETGEWPEFSPDKVTILELEPSMSMILNPIMAGLRATGLIQNPRAGADPLKSTPFDPLKGAFENITSFATPPALKAAATMMGSNLDLSGGTIEPRNTLTFGGANADNKTFNSEMSQQVYDLIGALTSGAGQIVAQTFDVFDGSMDRKGDVFEAAGRAFESFKSDVTQKFPDVAGLFNVSTKEYAFTPESQFVYDSERQLEPIIGSGRQMSVETDSKDRADSMVEQGLTPPSRISDPVLKQLSTMVYERIRKKGQYKSAGEAYTNLRADLNALEASRSRWPEAAYNAKRNEIVVKQQQQKAIQASALTDLQSEIQQSLGPVFEKMYGVPFTYGNLSNLVRKDVGE